MELARELRHYSALGVILISAKGRDIDRMKGLEAGADDYVPKPLNPAEVLLRAQAVLRRLFPEKPHNDDNTLVLGDITIDLQTRKIIFTNDDEDTLSDNEFQMLLTLASRRNQAMNRSDILATLKSREWNPTDRAVDILVGRLRKKLRDDANNPKMIITLRGKGYMLKA